MERNELINFIENDLGFTVDVNDEEVNLTSLDKMIFQQAEDDENTYVNVFERLTINVYRRRVSILAFIQTGIMDDDDEFTFTDTPSVTVGLNYQVLFNGVVNSLDDFKTIYTSVTTDIINGQSVLDFMKEVSEISPEDEELYKVQTLEDLTEKFEELGLLYEDDWEDDEINGVITITRSNNCTFSVGRDYVVAHGCVFDDLGSLQPMTITDGEVEQFATLDEIRETLDIDFDFEDVEFDEDDCDCDDDCCCHDHENYEFY